MILFELEVLHEGDEVGAKIGNPETKDPKTLSQKTTAGSSAASVHQKENMNGNTSAASNRQNQYQKRNESYANNETMNSSSGNLSEHLTMPIDSLSPYQNKWVIKARVTSKSAIRTWSNQRGEGKLFSMDLCDESGEIRATAFQAQVDKFYGLIEIEKVYYISKCQLKAANKQYSKLNNDYEMTFTNETVVQLCEDDISGIPVIKYEIIPISTLSDKKPGDIVDIIGVATNASDLANITAKATGRELTKREVTLVDQSNASITLTLWGEEAKSFDMAGQPVILAKGVRIGEFGGGKTLSTVSGSVIKQNPDLKEGHQLRGWFENGGNSNDIAQLSARTQGGSFGSSDWMTFQDMNIKNLGAGDKPDYFQVKGFIHSIRASNSFYKACPQPDCQKKVVDQENGIYRCDKCNADFRDFKYRLLVNVSFILFETSSPCVTNFIKFQMLVGDWTGNRWVTVFSEAAEAMLGKTAAEVGEALEHDKERADAIFSEVAFQPKVFKMRTKVETYGDVPRNKTTALTITDVNFKEYNKYLLDNIHRLTGIGKA